MINNKLLEKIINQALDEDLDERGDIISDAIFEDEQGAGLFIAKEVGVLAGLNISKKVFEIFDPKIEFQPFYDDGDLIKKGDNIAQVSGKIKSLLASERTALNFLTHLSGIATLANEFSKKIEFCDTKILDTRKTLPGLRALEKYASQVGGVTNHRMGLFDAVLIKDNHIAAAGGVEKAIQRVKENLNINPSYPSFKKGGKLKVEVECSTINQVKQALESGVDIIMLDNMSVEKISQALIFVAGKAKTEASGNVNLETVEEIAKTGVDYISVGMITSSAKPLDISFRIKG